MRGGEVSVNDDSRSIIFRNAHLMDGTGTEAHRSDVLVSRGRIVQVGCVSSSVPGEVIDLEGLTLAPGFIDLHTHSDVSLLRDGRAENQLMQGVTLEVVGNCGHSCAPLSQPPNLTGLTLGPELGSEPCWCEFEDYLDTLEASELGVNVAALVGHGALRVATMDNPQRGASRREIASLCASLDRALLGGAIGFSTGLEYMPGMCAGTDELASLCQVVARHDALYATHVRNRDVQYELGLGEALATARASQARLQVSHMTPKYGAPPHAAEHMLEMVGWCRDEGLDVAYDVIPHNWGPTAMASILPAWAFEGGTSHILDRLRDPAQRQAIKAAPNPIWRLVAEQRWDDIVLFGCEANPGLMGATLREIGRLREADPLDCVLDLLVEEEEGFRSVTWAGRNFADADTEALLEASYAGVISDSIAMTRDGPLGKLRWSPSAYGWVARFLQSCARQDGWMPMAEAVRRITSLPAARLGLRDRGGIFPGAWADMVVFDPANVVDRSTLAEPNTPPDGFRHVLVNGAFALRDGALTDRCCGTVVRGAAASAGWS